MRRKWFPASAVLAIAIFLSCTAVPQASQDIPRLSSAELKAKLNDPQVIILDVRSPMDWARSEAKIAGAVRENPRSMNWAGKYPKDKTLVLYCT